MVSHSHIRSEYNKNGYVIIPKLLGDVEPPVLFDAFNKIYYQGQDKYKAYLSVCAKLPSIQKMFLDYSIQETLKHLGMEFPVPPTYPVMNVMGLPISDGYNGTVAHQDWPSVQGSLDMITVWIPFMNIRKDNYPVEVIPGSHLKGLCAGKISDNVIEIDCDDDSFVPLECNMGDVIFMSGFLIHRTGPGCGLRISASMRFDNVYEKTFIERNYYCAQKRTVDRDIKWWPSVEQIRNVYVD